MKYAIFSLMLMIAGCASAQDWWQQPPADDSNHLYAIGEGKTINQARQEALAALAAKLGTTIASTMNRYTQDLGTVSTDDISRQITSNSDDVELSYFRVLQSRNVGDSVRVLLQLDRASLAHKWQQQIAHKTAIFESRLPQPANNLADVYQLYQLTPKAKAIDRLALQYASLTQQSPAPSLTEKLMKLQQQHGVTVQLSGNDAVIQQALEQQLINHGVKLCRSQCQNTVAFTLQEQQQQMFGKHVSIQTLNVEVEQAGQGAAAKTLKAQASSVTSQQTAHQGATEQLIKQLENQGLWLTVGYSS
ncbi:hypothetical protein CWI84_06340 [Idiomarina tyrosinivorans]|uniref:Lipoprotein LPP20-like domain-containing protein n=1 Tax=Idiomarina tyrosinivorans TaxID=1445662 RepID=A0A432ZQS0_9GAMM|nr:LPP20 family lipoprotein [Idiomarina tyrosinivorans]RUO80247.1 hypothetical protein CWI84_06340 [Idiomarina tyrosinivorans]